MRPQTAEGSQNRIIFLLLSLCTILLVMGSAGLWSWADWVRPHEISGDPLEIFARVKLAAEQPGQPFSGFSNLMRLGAPFGGDWSSYPAPDSLVFCFTGLISRFFGVFGAVKFVILIFALLNAWSFYFCARHLGWRAEWAFAGGLLFAFSNYNIRWAVTLSFNQTFTLPPLVLLCGHAAKFGARGVGGRGWLWLGVLLGAWLGQGNPYLACFSGFLATSVLGLALLRRAPAGRITPLGMFLVTLIVVFVLVNFQYAIHYLASGDENPLSRTFAGSLKYALKPMDWIMPPPEHRFPWLALVGRIYFSEVQYMGSYLPGYLGMIGILGLLGISLVTLQRLTRRAGARVPDAMLGLVLIVFYGAAGGFNSMLAFAGLDIFRASQRISILANIWALFFIFSWLQIRFRLTSRWVTIVLAAGIATAAWWEQTPKMHYGKSRQIAAAQWTAFETLARNIESATRPGAMVFQLPVRQFPEAGPMYGMQDYEHFLPFLADSSLRFSYGPMAHSRALAWQKYVAQLPASEMVATLESAGFSAIWINEQAYAHQGPRLVEQLAALPRAELKHDDGIPVSIVLLHPAAAPKKPDLDDMRYRTAWAPPPPGGNHAPTLYALRGWYPLEKSDSHRWRWARDEAELGIWNPAGPSSVRLKFNATALADDVLELQLDDRTVATIPLRRGETREIEIPLRLRPGNERLYWRFRGTPVRPQGDDTRQLGFMIEDLQALPDKTEP